MTELISNAIKYGVFDLHVSCMEANSGVANRTSRDFPNRENELKPIQEDSLYGNMT